jgi:hypothetical protein
MPLNNSKAARQRALARDLAAKLALESGLRVDVRRFFRDVAQDYRARYSTSGLILNLDRHRQELIGILRKHYRKAQKRFGNQIRTEIKALDDEIVLEQNEFVLKETEKQSGFIINTLQNDLQQVTAAAIENSASAAPEVIAATGALALRKLIPAKADLIAQTEIQHAAEGLKYIEGQMLNDSPDFESGKLTKEWMAIVDQNTRQAHLLADGQTRDYKTPFTVGGELMQHPGDTSLGASIGNVIRCRCSSVTIEDF